MANKKIIHKSKNESPFPGVVLYINLIVMLVGVILYALFFVGQGGLAAVAAVAVLVGYAFLVKMTFDMIHGKITNTGLVFAISLIHVLGLFMSIVAFRFVYVIYNFTM